MTKPRYVLRSSLLVRISGLDAQKII